VIVNLASGNNTENYFINVDLFPFSNVDIVASADDLPFADNSIDKIIIEASIEHIADPDQVMQEIHRVLKTNGLLFITAPFMVGYHDSPSDYWRWTQEGFKLLLKDFEIKEIGNKGGIASALGWVLAEFIATFFSFGSKKIHFVMFHVALVFLIPLKLLDFIFVYYPTTSNISSMFYAVAKKG
jgi:SAM-dependent methyltransferase